MGICAKPPKCKALGMLEENYLANKRTSEVLFLSIWVKIMIDQFECPSALKKVKMKEKKERKRKKAIKKKKSCKKKNN